MSLFGSARSFNIRKHKQSETKYLQFLVREIKIKYIKSSEELIVVLIIM